MPSPRTDDNRVCAIVDTDLTESQIQAFIETANLMVTNVLGSSVLSDDTLRLIETYLAAHYITLRDPRTQSEAADGIKMTYEGKTGEGLDSSHYGQTAQELDTTGQLKAIGKEDSIAWIARVGSERTNLTAADDLPTV